MFQEIHHVPAGVGTFQFGLGQGFAAQSVKRGRLRGVERLPHADHHFKYQPERRAVVSGGKFHQPTQFFRNRRKIKFFDHRSDPFVIKPGTFAVPPDHTDLFFPPERHPHHGSERQFFFALVIKRFVKRQWQQNSDNHLSALFSKKRFYHTRCLPKNQTQGATIPKNLTNPTHPPIAKTQKACYTDR